MCARDGYATHGGVPVCERKLPTPSCGLPIITVPAADDIDSIVPQQAAQLTINNRPSAFMWHDAARPEDRRNAGFGLV